MFGYVCIFSVCAHMCLPLGVSVWGLCVVVCECVFLFPCLLFCGITVRGEKEKLLYFFSTVLLCEHDRKVFFNTQITAPADKAAFRVGSNP